MKSSGFTKAHLRALEFLPPDGSWVRPTRSIAAALNSLILYHGELVEHGWEGQRSSSIIWHLTPAGIAAKSAHTAVSA